MYLRRLSIYSTEIYATPEETASLQRESYSMYGRRENGSDSTSANAVSLAVKIAVPLLATLFSLLVLLALKAFYLKQRRLHDIHQIPNLIHKQHETLQDPDKSPTLTINSKNQHSVVVDAKNDARRASYSGFFVGLLGSPNWEAKMQRHIADDRWRQFGGNQHRHTWHPPSTPLSPTVFSPGRLSQTSPSIPSPLFDRFECPSIEDIQQGFLRRHHSLSMILTHDLVGAEGASKKRKSLEGAFNTSGDASGGLRRGVYNTGSRRLKDRISHTPEITISVADDTNPQNASLLLPSNSFRLESDFPAAYVKNHRTVSPCPSHSSFLSLASTTHSKSSIIDCDMDNTEDFEEKISSTQYPSEARLRS